MMNPLSIEHTVIVVDDDPAIQLLVIECLEQAKDFRVLTCLNGESALELLEETETDIVLLDINMPGIDGIETCRRVRKHHQYHQLPILMMTGMDDIDSINQSYEAGATDFITKPLNWPLLIHHLRYMLKASKTLIENDYYMQSQALNLNLSGLSYKEFQSIEWLLIDAMKLIKSYRICLGKEIKMIFDNSLISIHGLTNIPIKAQKLYLQSPVKISETKRQYTHKNALFFPLRYAQQEIGILAVNNTGNAFFTPFFRSIADKLSQLIEHYKGKQELNLAASYFSHSLEGIIITNEFGTIIRVNKAFSKITGHTNKDVIGQNISILESTRHTKTFYNTILNSINATNSWQGEIWTQHKTGRVFPKWLSIVKINQSNNPLFIGVFVDISKQKQQEESIENLAYYDSLTGIGNRTLFYDQLELALQQTNQHEKGLAVALLDLDRFKLFNETMGLKYGDELLIHVANRLKQVITNGHSVARLNSDEFIILLTNIDPDYGQAKKQITTIINHTQSQLNATINLANKEINLVCSIGISHTPTDGNNAIELIRNANIAMQQCKKNGGNSHTFFEIEMLKKGKNKFNIELSLQRAIRCNELQLYYQPQFDKNGKIIAAECLLRWDTPEYGMIPPHEFIPVAEESGIIKSIGDWVIDRACKNIITWKEKGLMDAEGFKYLAVNISPRQLSHQHFIEDLDQILLKNGLADLSYLELELTESCLISNSCSTLSLVNQLHHMGLRLSLDDFGTGYSSLSYLKDFELNTLKIDQSFVKECLSNQKNATIIKTIISMSQSLELNIIAEGVENQEQWQFLADNQCQFFQGYHLAKPMPLETFEKQLISVNRPYLEIH